MDGSLNKSALKYVLMMFCPIRFSLKSLHEWLLIPIPSFSSVLSRVTSCIVMVLVAGSNDIVPLTPSIMLRSAQLRFVTSTPATLMPYFIRGAIATVPVTTLPPAATPFSPAS